MNVALSTGILYLFVASVLVALAVAVWREGALKQLAFSISPHLFKQFAIFLLAVGALLGLRGFFADDAWTSELLFAVGALLPFVLKRFGVQSGHLGVILLLLAVCQTRFFTEQLSTAGMLATLFGLGVYKILENIIFGLENNFDDVLPAFIWLAGSYWLSTGISTSAKPVQENILLVCLTLSVLLKTIQTPFLTEDKSYIKRILLAAVGGLGLLLILTKVLLLPKMAPLAALFAAGLLFAYMFEPVGQSEDKQNTFDPVRLLVLIGVLTLGATRLFGTLGLLVLVPTTVVATVSEGVVLAGMFWISRVLLQAFVALYNSNITGINLMHAYTSAALYGGVVVVCLLSLALRDVESSWMKAAIVLLACSLLPPGIIYFLHEEPTGSFLVAATVAGISLVSLIPILYKRQETSAQKNLMLTPVLMTTACLLCGQLVERGNQATASGRFQLVLFITACVFLIYLVFYFYNLLKGRRQPVEVPRGES